MGRRFGLACFALFISIAAAAQSKQDLTIVTKSELVVIPVVVTQGGSPVRGLHASDFVLKESGKERSIDTFEEVEIGPGSPFPRLDLPPRTAQNFINGGESHQDVAILLLDFLNGSWSSRARIRSYLKEMAAKFQESKTPFSVFLLTTRGLIQVQSLTNTPDDFVATVDSLHLQNRPNLRDLGLMNYSAQPYLPMSQQDSAAALGEFAYGINFQHGRDFASAHNLDVTSMTMQALEQLSEAYRGVPGRKKLVWLTIGIPEDIDILTREPNDPGYQFKVAEKSFRALKALNTANIAVYPIDSNGVANPAWNERFNPSIDPNHPMAPSPSTVEYPTNTMSLIQFADKTGGKNCTAHPDDCLGRALDDAKTYYVVGFYLHGETRKGWHKLSVEVKKEGVSVRSRPGFLVGEQPGNSDPTKDVVLTALASSIDYTSVPLKLQWIPATGSKPSKIELRLTSPPGGIALAEGDPHISVDMLAYVTPMGKKEGTSFPVSLSRALTPTEAQSLAKNGFAFRKELALAPGTYQVRVLLRDNATQKIGTVSTVVTVAN